MVIEVEPPQGVKPGAVRRSASRDDEDLDRPDSYDNDGGLSVIIPYRNPRALASYYLGIFSLLPVIGIFSAIAAIILGIMALRYRSAHPEAKGGAHAIIGMVAGAIGLFTCQLLYGVVLSIYLSSQALGK
jgi:hypothetical protein